MDRVSFEGIRLWVTYRQNVFQSGLEKVSQLLLGNQLEHRWFQWVPSDVVEEFHGKSRVVAWWLCGVCTLGSRLEHQEIGAALV
jgi:hypothetical protein